MNILFKINSIIIIALLWGVSAAAQEKAPDFRLKAEIASGINYTYDFKAVIPGEYRKNAVPLTAGFEVVYKDTYGIRISAGYYPVLFFTELEQYRLEDISIDASLTARIVILSLRYYWGDIIFEGGGSFALLRSSIKTTLSGSKAAESSFGYNAGISYQIGITEGIKIEPGIMINRIIETESSTLTFRLAVTYPLFNF